PPPASGPQPHQPTPPPSYGYPPQPHAHRTTPYGAVGPYPRSGQPGAGRGGGKNALLIAAVAVVVALAAGGTVYAVMNSGDRGGSATGAEGPDGKGGDGTTGSGSEESQGDRGPGGGSSSPDGEPTPTPEPSESGSEESPDTDDAVPSGFVGEWRAQFGTGSQVNTRAMSIRQGRVGERVMTLHGYGPDYSCRWTATLRASGPPLELNESQLVSGDRTKCSPGEWSRLTLGGDGVLTRELVGSGGEPVTYRRLD
ncbi:serine/threonine protein kinase, partial [Streptomyces sp. OF3]|nr:serine/threonine protein kinase [Streptomyces alkaliterrae]